MKEHLPLITLIFSIPFNIINRPSSHFIIIKRLISRLLSQEMAPLNE